MYDYETMPKDKIKKLNKSASEALSKIQKGTKKKKLDYGMTMKSGKVGYGMSKKKK
ncbi:MAG: hypothetical protein WC479_11950 [Candidatus Izemoplasmatales bacterium]|jgi:hypothetical protein